MTRYYSGRPHLGQKEKSSEVVYPQDAQERIFVLFPPDTRIRSSSFIKGVSPDSILLPISGGSS